jgi:hypothetical protein
LQHNYSISVLKIDSLRVEINLSSFKQTRKGFFPFIAIVKVVFILMVSCPERLERLPENGAEENSFN